MFHFGKSGPQFSRITLQIFYTVSLIYLSTYIVFYTKLIYSKYKDVSSNDFLASLVVSMVISPIIMILVWAITFPQILTKFTIITNVSSPNVYQLRLR